MTFAKIIVCLLPLLSAQALAAPTTGHGSASMHFEQLPKREPVSHAEAKVDGIWNGKRDAIEAVNPDGISNGKRAASIEPDGIWNGKREAAKDATVDGIWNGKRDAADDVTVDGIWNGKRDTVDDTTVDGIWNGKISTPS